MQTQGRYLRWSVVDSETLDVTNTSNYSGKEHTLRIKATPQQFTLWNSGALVQEAFPNLTPDEREFIISGITKEEWNELFGE
jgi:hypothetical protein